LQLHDVENALANVVAMTFWAGDYFRLHIWASLMIWQASMYSQIPGT
jgi:hypothetical protein